MTVTEQARAIRAAMDTAGAVLTDDQAIEAAAIYPVWTEETEYIESSRVRYAGNLDAGQSTEPLGAH